MEELKTSLYDDFSLQQAVRRYIHSSVARDVDDALKGYSSVTSAAQSIIDGNHPICVTELRNDVQGVYNSRTQHWEALHALEEPQ